MARPDRPKVCVIGDGGFMFNAPEIATAVSYMLLNVVTIVFRDDAYGDVARDLDDLFGGTVRDRPAQPGPGPVQRGLRTRSVCSLMTQWSWEHCFPWLWSAESPVVIDVPVGDICRYPARQAACVCLAIHTLDAAPGRPDNLLNGARRFLGSAA